MSKRSGSMFDDLNGLDVENVEAMFEATLAELSGVEATLVDLHVRKRIHSETIKFAVNKTRVPPVVEDEHTDLIIASALKQKSVFDACLTARDELVERLVVPRHRVAHTLAEFYHKLTASNHEDAPTLAAEMDMFSKFFEFQSMLTIYKEQQNVLHDLNRARRTLLETVKDVNRNDRRLAQRITQARERSKTLRTEAGRLRTYLEKNSKAPKDAVPPPSADVSERLLAGEALTMEEFASMLEHGGLTDVKPPQAIDEAAPKPNKTSMRRAAPRRGVRRTGPGKRE